MPARALTTPAFPDRYFDLLEADSGLQDALDRAIAAGPGDGWRAAVAVVSLSPDGTRPMAQFRGEEMHYSASLLKVAAMYAAFELRNTLRTIAAELGASTSRSTLLKDAAAYLDPQIMAAARAIPALRGVAQMHAVPRYASTFEVGTGLTVGFTSTFAQHLEKMIAISDNGSAAHCVQGCGYGYLNGALAAAGFFDPASEVGVWLGGDYAGSYPYFRIPSVNDGRVAQATSVVHLARMYALLHDGRLVDELSSREMMQLLAKAVEVPEVFIDRASGLDFSVTHTKVGLGPLKPENGGQNVYSEGSILQHARGRKFIAVWQNFLHGDEGFDPIGLVVRDTIRAFLAQ